MKTLKTPGIELFSFIQYPIFGMKNQKKHHDFDNLIVQDLNTIYDVIKPAARFFDDGEKAHFRLNFPFFRHQKYITLKIYAQCAILTFTNLREMAYFNTQ